MRSVIVCLLLLAAGAHADVVEGEEELFALEEELVTAASRTAEPLRLAPASVTVISRDEIVALGSNSVADALVGVRGLFVTDDRFYSSVGVRGFKRAGDYGNRVQLQLDGHVMNDDWIFSSYIGNDGTSDLEHVSQIEVVRGPGSALYGTGAFFGVINVTTPNQAPAHALRASAALLDFGTVRAHVDGGHQFNDGPLAGLGFWAAAGTQTRPGQDLQQDAYRGTPWAPDGTAQDVDAHSTATLNAKAFWGDLTLQGAFHQRNKRVATGVFGAAFGDQRNFATDARGFVELRYEPELPLDLGAGKARLLSRAYVDGYGYEGTQAFTDASILTSRDTYTGLWGGSEARLQLPILTHLQASTGVEVQLHPFNNWLGKEQAVDEPYVDQSEFFAYVSAYAVADWKVVPWLSLNAGLRFDGWLVAAEDVDSQGLFPSLNPRLAAIWLPTDEDTLKLMGGRAYRIPSMYEFAGSQNGFDFSGDSLGPETIYTAELEYRRALPAQTNLILSTYVNRVSELIENFSFADQIEAYTNLPDPLFTIGTEAEVRHQTRDGTIAAAQVTLQRTRVGSPFGDEEVFNSPEQQVAAWLVLPLAKDGLLMWGNRGVVESGRLDRDGQRTDPMVLVDSTLSGSVGGFRWSAGVRNLLDWRYTHPVSVSVRAPTIQQDGRTIRLEMSASF